MGAVRSFCPTRLAAALAALCSIGAGGCGLIRGAAHGPLPAVSPAPTPHAATWIVRYGPRGTVDTLAQIRIEFKDPLIPLESLESPDEAAKLEYFSIEPALPGRFRFLTPHLVGFQADAALPIATRIRVVVKSGLTDVHGAKLPSDFAWTFNTEQLVITSHLSGESVALSPTLEFSSNAELDPASLAQTTSVTTVSGGASVPIKVTLERSQTPQSVDAAEKFDPSIRDWYYGVTFEKPLPKATSYELKVAAGLMPAHGNLPLSKTGALDVDFHTFAPLKVTAVSHRFDEETFIRFSGGDPEVIFNNPIDDASARANITISPTPNPWASLVEQSYGSTQILLDPAAFDPAKHYTVTIGAGVKDVFGQTLGKDVTAPFDTGDTAAAFWAPTGLNIFPTGVDLALRFSAVNIPDKRYRAAYRVVQPTDIVGLEPGDYSYNGGDLLPAPARWASHSLAAVKNTPSDISIPLRELLGGSTGMVVYGVSAETGKRNNESPYYGAVQLTDLGVFAQWFPSSGLVLVHHLSDGSPAGGARVDVYKSTSNPG